MTRHRIILLAHGSSDPRWCETFEAMAAPTLDAHPNARVAYMELAPPRWPRRLSTPSGTASSRSRSFPCSWPRDAIFATTFPP